jgi:thiol-disulfide isomerase/thioredoxin
VNLKIDSAELSQLLKTAEKMELLDAGKVHAWEWYDESLKGYNHEEQPDLSGYGAPDDYRARKYYQNQALFYNDNPCRFVAYLSNDIAVIVVSIAPKIDDLDGSSWCTPCQIGGKEKHTCYEYNDVIEHLAETVKETVIPLVVNVNLMHKKPPITCKHEKKIAVLKNDIQAAKEEAKKLIKVKAELAGEIAMRKEELEELEKIEQD